MKNKMIMALLMTVMLLLLAACAGNGNERLPGQGVNDGGDDGVAETNVDSREAIGMTGSEKVTVTMKDSNGEKAGRAVLSETTDGVNIHLKLTGLSSGKHGFHIHETGKCLAPNFKSAGGHFNPTGSAHGHDHSKGAHAGDLPNLEVAEKGSIEQQFTAEHVTLEKGKDNSLFDSDGSALVIHETADDGKSQPSGDAGKRIICGVIGK